MLGGGGGSIFEMINRLKNNNSLLKKPRYFDDAKKDLRIHAKIAHLDTKATPQQLKKIREKLEEQRQQAHTLMVVAVIVGVLVTCVIAWFFVSLLH